MKVNRILILMLVLVIMTGILSGCGNNDLPEGIENRKFFKDFSEFYDIVIESMGNGDYNKAELDKSLDKLNKHVDSKKLNEYEELIVDTINTNILSIKEDLIQDNIAIKSEVMDEFRWVLELMSNYYQDKNNK